MSLGPLLAAGGTIDFGPLLLDLALVLVLAKVAAELFERMRLPAVLGEILVGIAIGPSALGLVDPSDALKILAEIGVIMLLAQVGLEMDLRELRRVGRASLLVGVFGVVFPMAGGLLAGRALGETLNASLFLGAALAATSVGITARVFGDLRALSSREARIVLGAAVADDVLGMIILTVVTRVVTEGTFDVGAVLSTLGIAIAFLAASVGLGVVLVPRVFRRLGNAVSSPAVIGVLAAALTFGLAAAADAARLAPIIGAFVAGIALAGTDQHDRIERDFAVLGGLLIPVFFVQIGVETDVAQFVDGEVLALAAVLSVIAIATKLVAALGATGTGADRLLVGIGMVPRGEVGLIFAAIGMQVGVFGDDLYAVVLLVVLLTTLIAPPLLRVRLGGSRRTPASAEPGAGLADSDAGSGEKSGAADAGGVTVVGDSLRLDAVPERQRTLEVLLRAARLGATSTPDAALMAWVDATRAEPLVWTREASLALVELVRLGNHRSWRFVEVAAVAERALPELARLLDSRHSDATELDPTRVAAFPIVETIRHRLPPGDGFATDHSLLLAALMADMAAEGIAADGMLARLDLDPSTLEEAEALMNASSLLRATVCTEPLQISDRTLAQLADYLGSPINVEKCRLLTEARTDLKDWQYSALLDVTIRVQQLLAHPELIEGRSGSVEDVRRTRALALVEGEAARTARVREAPASYVLAHEPETIARHVGLVEPVPAAGRARVAVSTAGDSWIVDVATRDTDGLLARVAAVLTGAGLDIVNADLNTWPDGAVLDSFTVNAVHEPDAESLRAALEAVLGQRRLPAAPLRYLALDVRFDHRSHPWHSIVLVRGRDEPGVLMTVAAAFARAGIRVHQANIASADGTIADRFEVSDRHGRQLSDRLERRVLRMLS